eukprot:447781-Amphidinium_carterae.1
MSSAWIQQSGSYCSSADLSPGVSGGRNNNGACQKLADSLQGVVCYSKRDKAKRDNACRHQKLIAVTVSLSAMPQPILLPQEYQDNKQDNFVATTFTGMSGTLQRSKQV